MIMANPETNLTNRIRKAIRDNYPEAWIHKVHGGQFQSSGVPDLLVVIDGHLFGLEVKCPQPGESRAHALGRATPRQVAQIEAIRRAGGTADVILDPDAALTVIESRLNPRKVPDPAC